MSLNRIIRLVSTHTNKECSMCNDTRLGKRWEYKSYQSIPSYNPPILLICEKCVYKENYGNKTYKKAKKQNLLEKLNYNFGDKLPRLEK